MGHSEEPIHFEFHPSQREFSWQWSRCETSQTTWLVMEPYRALHIFHSLLVRTILRSWAVVAGNSYLAPASHAFDSAPLRVLNIPLNFALKYWNGVTKVLISSFKRLTGFSWNGTAGTFFPPLFRVSWKGKPPIPRAFFMSLAHYILSWSRHARLNSIWSAGVNFSCCMSFIIEGHLRAEFSQVCIRILCFEIIADSCPCFICNFIRFIWPYACENFVAGMMRRFVSVKKLVRALRIMLLTIIYWSL